MDKKERKGRRKKRKKIRKKGVRPWKKKRKFPVPNIPRDE